MKLVRMKNIELVTIEDTTKDKSRKQLIKENLRKRISEERITKIMREVAEVIKTKSPEHVNEHVFHDGFQHIDKSDSNSGFWEYEDGEWTTTILKPFEFGGKKYKGIMIDYYKEENGLKLFGKVETGTYKPLMGMYLV